MDISRALSHLRPGAKWKMGTDFSTLEMLDSTTPPTLAECEAALAELTAMDTAKTEARAAMAAAFDALSISDQAAFYSARLDAEEAMDRGRFDIAKAIVEAVQVPQNLEATKQSILDLFPQ